MFDGSGGARGGVCRRAHLFASSSRLALELVDALGARDPSSGLVFFVLVRPRIDPHRARAACTASRPAPRPIRGRSPLLQSKLGRPITAAARGFQKTPRARARVGTAHHNDDAHRKLRHATMSVRYVELDSLLVFSANAATVGRPYPPPSSDLARSKSRRHHFPPSRALPQVIAARVAARRTNAAGAVRLHRPRVRQEAQQDPARGEPRRGRRRASLFSATATRCA